MLEHVEFLILTKNNIDALDVSLFQNLAEMNPSEVYTK